MKHTKGKWVRLGYKIVSSTGVAIANLVFRGNKHKEEVEANAKLIASAPNMLKELLRLQGLKPRHPEHHASTFTSKSEYDKAYKSWMKTEKIIKEASE